jgi:hypothetical protein
MDIQAQPDALDRAALSSTVGSPFWPGIESWCITRCREIYAATLRIDNKNVLPGDLTIGNACPWQTDYADCGTGWWPAQRPNQVKRDGELGQPWAPKNWGYQQMVRGWYQLGFVVEQANGDYADTESQAEEEPSA